MEALKECLCNLGAVSTASTTFPLHMFFSVSKKRCCEKTTVAQEGLDEEITWRTLTHTSWDLSSSKDRERRGWHPVTYKLADATTTLIQSIKDIDNIYYETEYHREWCTNKAKPSLCFLFARKFTRPAALRLLNIGKEAVKYRGEKKLQVI
ncbi:hypothetical protein HYC85_017493 [Camellia sinensis]|uniref:Uncharacterized protein n=1 Tax=Camellia sinensis TaxID=4442 RepID=A0A7J7GV81_CAMSI|nr:hypothetical protein HYC85_017493 [Camellia sinensis]